MCHSYIPNMRSVQASLVEISCLQGFHNLTPVDHKWPLTSTKNNRVLVLNVVHLHTKYEICPIFPSGDIVFTSRRHTHTHTHTHIRHHDYKGLRFHRNQKWTKFVQDIENTAGMKFLVVSLGSSPWIVFKLAGFFGNSWLFLSKPFYLLTLGDPTVGTTYIVADCERDSRNNNRRHRVSGTDVAVIPLS